MKYENQFAKKFLKQIYELLNNKKEKNKYSEIYDKNKLKAMRGLFNVYR